MNRNPRRIANAQCRVDISSRPFPDSNRKCGLTCLSTVQPPHDESVDLMTAPTISAQRARPFSVRRNILQTQLDVTYCGDSWRRDGNSVG